MVGKKSVYMREAVVIRKTLRTRMDRYFDIEQKSIIHLLWAIFLDARDFFSKEVQQGEALPESMLRYTTNFLEVGRIPTDITAVLVAQFGGEEQIQSRVAFDREGSRARAELFKPEEFVPHRNTDIHEDISGIADGNLENHSKFVLVLVLFYLLLFFRVRTIIQYCFTVALIPIRMYINLVLYY